MDKASIKELLRKENFKAWLNSKPKRSIVGTRGVGQSCPIATYLKENNALNDEGYVGRWICDSSGKFNYIYGWERCFIRKVDGEVERRGGKCTAGTALKYLEEC